MMEPRRLSHVCACIEDRLEYTTSSRAWLCRSECYPNTHHAAIDFPPKIDFKSPLQEIQISRHWHVSSPTFTCTRLKSKLSDASLFTETLPSTGPLKDPASRLHHDPCVHQPFRCRRRPYRIIGWCLGPALTFSRPSLPELVEKVAASHLVGLSIAICLST